MALIKPAKSNPHVVVYAIASRDETRAIAFGQKHGVPNVRGTYDGMMVDGYISRKYY